MQRIGETITFDVAQDGNTVSIRAGDIDIYFAVEGVTLPPCADASFAVWAVLPWAMEEGFNFHIYHPIDPLVAVNADRLSQIWEMWAPSQFRSIKVSGQGGWARLPRTRRPEVHLYSGGINSTYSILRHRDLDEGGVVATVCGIDRIEDSNFAQLVAKTEPLLKALHYNKNLIRTNARRAPAALTHGFMLAACLFLLSDLFGSGTLAADSTYAEDMATFPWGTNHVTNEYFAGLDFSVRTVGTEVKRTEKIVAISDAGIDPHALSFCRNRETIPQNCGTCRKCIRNKAMFLVATGSIPEIFIDNSFDENMMRGIGLKYEKRVHLFDIYQSAKDRGVLAKIPGLASLVEEFRTRAGKRPKS